MYDTNIYFVVKKHDMRKHDMRETKDLEETFSKDIWL